MQMTIEFAEVYNKANYTVHGSGYFSCDCLAQELIGQAQLYGIASLKGGPLDVDPSILVSQIIDVIEKGTPTEVVSRQVYILTDIQLCMRFEWYTPA